MKRDDENINVKNKSKFGQPTHPTLITTYDPSIRFEQGVMDYIRSKILTLKFSESSDQEKTVKAENFLKVSFNMIANSLNNEGIKTKRGKSWTRTSVKRLIEVNGGNDAEKIGHKESRWQKSAIIRRRKSDIFAIKMRDEVLPLLDITQKHHIIAQELNDRGIQTRSGKGKWGNAAVKRLLIRIGELSG